MNKHKDKRADKQRYTPQSRLARVVILRLCRYVRLRTERRTTDLIL